MPRINRFQISAKSYFLTYPHCSLTKEEALQQIQHIQTPTSKKYIKIRREVHEDGEPHLHVLIQFEGIFNFKTRRFFDLVSPDRLTHFHPKIQGAKSSTDVKSYIDKDGDTIEWGEFQMDGRSGRGGMQHLADVYAEALNAGDKQSALQIIAEKDPRSYVFQFRNLSADADRFFTPQTIFISNWDPKSFHVPENIEKWIGDNFENNPAARPENNNRYILRRNIDRPMSIIIEGPTRTGKTEWARSLGRHNYLSGYLDLSPNSYSNEADYNVIDNIAPRDLKLKYWKELIGAKHDWQSKYKY